MANPAISRQSPHRMTALGSASLSVGFYYERTLTN
jgi:hypothetical protein